MSPFVRSSLVPLVLALCSLLLSPSRALAAARDVEVTGVVNLNTASETELRQLPGIGPAKAQRILELRAKRKFDNPEQLMRVKGIGRKTYRRLKPNLAVSGPTTIQRTTKSASARATAGDETAKGAEVAAATGREESVKAARAHGTTTAGKLPPGPRRVLTASGTE